MPDLDLSKWYVIGGWISIEAGQCTCGNPGGMPGHEPYCGTEPLIKLYEGEEENAAVVVAGHNALVDEVRRLRATIAAADAIHRPHEHTDMCDSRPWAPCDMDEVCRHDGETWPCPTHTALHPDEVA